MSCRLLKEIANPEFWQSLIRDNKLRESFSREINMTVKEASYALPTARETEALPFLELLGDQLIDLMDGTNYLDFFETIYEDEELMEIFFYDLFIGSTDAVFKGKLYHEKKIVQSADIIFSKLVELTTNLLKNHSEGENFFVLRLLGNLLDRRMEYYRNTGRESLSTFPFGESLKTESSKKVWVEESLYEGMRIDCIRATNGKKIWTRGIYLGGSSTSFTRVRYESDGTENYLSNRYHDLALHGVRSTDYEWRNSIKKGDYVDILTMNKSWVLARVKEVKVKKIFIAYRQDHNKSGGLFGAGNKKNEDSDNETAVEEKYEDNEEGFWNDQYTLIVVKKNAKFEDTIEVDVNPHTSVVAQPGRYSERTSSTDDSEDKFYSPLDPSKIGIMRVFTTYSTSSVYFIKYINIFGSCGGLGKLLSFLNKKDLNQGILMQYTKILRSLTDFLVEDVIKSHGALLLKKLVTYALNCTEKHLRDTSQDQLQTLLDAIEGLSLRLMSKKRSQRILNLILLKVFFICVESEILDKQNFAMKIFNKIERNIIMMENSDTYSKNLHGFDKNETIDLEEEKKLINSTIDIFKKNCILEKELIGICDMSLEEETENSTLTKEIIASLLEKHKILTRITKGHGSLIQKSTTIIKLLFSTEKISMESIADLWELINKAEADTRTNLLGLLKDASWQMGIKYIKCFINYITEHLKTSEMPMDFLEFVIEIRKVASDKHSDSQSIQLVNDILWEMINKEGVEKDVFKKSLEWLIRFTVNDDDMDVTEKLFQKALHNLDTNENVFISIKVIAKILHETKMEQYYIKQIINRKIHLKMVELIKKNKNSIESNKEFRIQGVVVNSKDKEYYKFLKKLLKFLGKIVQEDEDNNEIIKDVIFELWLFFFESSNNESKESDQINKFVKTFLDKKLGHLDVNMISDLLRENIPKMENCKWNGFFELFKKLIWFVNEKNGNVVKDHVVLDGGYFNDYNTKRQEFYVLRVPSQELNFFNEIESLFLCTKNCELEKSLCEFICSLITKPNYASSETDALYKQEENKLIQRALKYLNEDDIFESYEHDQIPQKLIYKIKFLQILNNCIGLGEPFGSGALISFASQKEGIPLLLNFEKENSYSAKTTSKFFFNNCNTLYDLRVKLAKDFNLRPECVGLKKKKDKTELRMNWNNQTLVQLQIQNQDHFEFFEIDVPEKAEEKLTNYDCEFTEKARKVFEEVFKRFSTDGLMGSKHIADFICKATDFSMCSENDDRVKNFLKDYDINNDGFIELPQFLEFYLTAALNKKSTVFDNLRSLGYDKDLRLKVDEDQANSIDYKDSIRYKLIETGDQFIVSILKHFDQMTIKCSDLIKLIKDETEDMAKKEQLRNHFNLVYRWSRVLKKFIYTMPPCINMIESIIFGGYKTFENLNDQGHIGIYKLYILFLILFKQEQIKKMLEIISQNKTDILPTSNDNLHQDDQLLNSTRKDPWDESIESTSQLTPAVTLDSVTDNIHQGTLLQRIATTLNLEQSVQDLFTKFTNKFFEKNFFLFISENLSKKIENNQLKILLIKLLERGLLIIRCQDDMKNAKMLGMLNHYTRIKKMELKKSKSKESATQTDGKKAGPKNLQETSAEKNKKGFSSGFNKNTIVEFNLEELGKTIEWEHYEKLESEIDRTEMCKNVINIINDLSEKKSLNKKEERTVTKSALVGLLCLLTPLKKDIEEEGREMWILKREQSIDSLLEDESSLFKKFIIRGLMNSEVALVRFCFRNFYSFLLDNLTNLNHKSEFLKLLVKTILSNQEEDVHLLIELAGNLFSEIMKDKKPDSNEKNMNIDFNKLFWEFFNKFEGHESREVKFGDPVDYTLVSSLSFMDKILKTDPEILKSMEPKKKTNLVLNLLQKCLFKVDSQSIEYDHLKCKTTASREAALNLLSCLAKDDIRTTILIFLKGLTALAEHIPIPHSTSRNYTMMLEFEKKSSLGFLGIKNLGCICYMISMLQQFFCTETFTRGILMANDHVEVTMSEVKGRQVDDNVFHQFQTMFGFLQNSHRREYNPLEFCLSYKDYGGQPVNISLQQDAQEFLNCIFDRLESSLKKTPFKGILDSVYSGTKIHLIECKACGYVRTNKEIFYNLSLDVKGLKNMNQSFKKFIEPETISDFLCDNCKQKCDISKCSYLKEVPNVLIVHLKKMIFDLDFMANIKIGTRYEFPKKLNLKDYIVRQSHLNPKTKKDEEQTEDEIAEEKEKKDEEPEEELLDEDFEYKLVGVVIHKGTAEWGHYVSLIDANRGKDDEKWLLFDDGHVSEFKMENFDEECFGSSSNKEEYGHSLYEMADTFAGASKSAYVLVYDKIKKSKIHFEFSEENLKEKDFIIDNLIDKTNYKFEDNILETGFYNLGQYIPPQIKSKIDKDNKQFILEQQLFSSTFLGFFADVLINSGLPIVLIEYLDGYHQIKLDPFDNEGYKTDSEGNVPQKPELTNHQKVLLDIFGKILPQYYFNLYCNSNELYKLQAVEKLLERVFILKPQKAWEFFCFNVKANINKIFQLVISNTETIIRTSVGELVASCLQVVMKCFNINLLKSTEEMNEPEKMVREVIDKYLNVLNHMENPNTYKKLPQYFYLLYKALIRNPKLQDFLIEKQYVNDLYEFYISKVETKTYSKDAHERALNYLLGILSILFKRLKKKYFNDSSNGAFYKRLFGNFLDTNFFKKMLKEDYFFSNFEFIKQLVFLACEDNELLSIKVIATCLEGIQTSGTNDIMPYLESIKALLCIHDKVLQLRIKCIFGVPKLEETKLKSQGKPLYLFGLAKENNLHKSVYTFYSPILKQKSLTQMMLDKNDHFREWVTVVLCTVMTSIYSNDSILAHLLKLPNPHYHSGNCLDWIWKFAKEVDLGNNISYSIMRQEIQYFYLRNFKDKVNDFIVYVRNKLGITKTPHIVLFEEDWEIDCTKYKTNGQTLGVSSDHRMINSPVLKSFRNIFDRFINDLKESNKKKAKELFPEEKKEEEEEEDKENESEETPTKEKDQLQDEETKDEINVKKSSDSEDENQENKIRIPMAPPLKSFSKDKIPEVTSESPIEEKVKYLQQFQRVIFSYQPFDMIGKPLKNKNMKRIDLFSIEETKYNDDYEEEKVINSLQLNLDVQQVLTRESLPLGSKGNMNIPKDCVHNNHYLKGNSSMKNKSFSSFVRLSNKDEEEVFKQNEVKPYFHDVDEIKPSGKQDYRGMGNDYEVDFEDDKNLKEIDSKFEHQDKDNTHNDNTEQSSKKNSNDNTLNDNLTNSNNKVESIIRLGITNRTEENFLVKFEFNKIEDIDFTKQILQRGYYDSDNPAELIWSDNDAYSEDETQDEQNYEKRVYKNHKVLGNKIFRKQKETKRVKESLGKNYIVSDILKGVSLRKKDTPIVYIRKYNNTLPFGDLVIKVSWVKVDKTGLKSLERNIGSQWDWKLIRLRLSE